MVYYLSNGTTCKRSYNVDRDSHLGYALEAHLSDYKQVFFTNDWNTYADAVTKAWFESYYYDKHYFPLNEYGEYHLSREQIPGLLAALRADCDAGYMAQDWAYFRNDWQDTQEEGVCWLTLESDLGRETAGTDNRASGFRQVSLHITTDCINTVAYLENLGA